MDVKIVRLAIGLGLLSIILGAFGAHALKEVLSAQQLTSFETGVKYQMYQSFFLLFVGSTNKLTVKTKKTATIILFLGVLFFSGSIYLLSIQNVLGIKLSFLGPVTPIGGLLIMISWLLVGLKISKTKN